MVRPIAYSTPSSLSSWVRMIVRALDARGVDGQALAVKAGLDLHALDDPNARYAVSRTGRLWRLAVEATRDPSFGLFVSRFVRQTTLHALGYSAMASRTLKEAFGRLVRYSRVVSDSVQFRLEEERTLYRLVAEIPPGSPRPEVEAIDALAALIVRAARALHDDPTLNPLAVALERPEPSAAEPFRRFFRVPVRFSAPANYIEFARQAIDASLPSANADLARSNDAVVREYLERVNEERVRSRVQAVVAGKLPDGRPTQAFVARTLGMSLRSLQRRLTEEGTSYKEILSATRRDLARSYVHEARLSVTEIAFLLGFVDTSSFCRAFKRWTGQSPSRYRSAVRGGRE